MGQTCSRKRSANRPSDCPSAASDRIFMNCQTICHPRRNDFLTDVDQHLNVFLRCGPCQKKGPGPRFHPEVSCPVHATPRRTRVTPVSVVRLSSVTRPSLSLIYKVRFLDFVNYKENEIEKTTSNDLAAAVSRVPTRHLWAGPRAWA